MYEMVAVLAIFSRTSTAWLPLYKAVYTTIVAKTAHGHSYWCNGTAVIAYRAAANRRCSRWCLNASRVYIKISWNASQTDAIIYLINSRWHQTESTPEKTNSCVERNKETWHCCMGARSQFLRDLEYTLQQQQQQLRRLCDPLIECWCFTIPWSDLINVFAMECLMKLCTATGVTVDARGR